METKSKCEVHQGFANLQNGIHARRVRKSHGIPEMQGFLTQICLCNLWDNYIMSVMKENFEYYSINDK